jgi:gluconate kinase
MLKSRFEALEEPVHALVVDIHLTPEEIIEKIIKVFQL